MAYRHSFGELSAWGAWMKIVGREKEQAALRQYHDSGAPEFLALYGRRRVGKTFLIREYFGGRFDFYVTGLAGGKKEEQLWAWNMAVKSSFGETDENAASWLDAFALLRKKLEKLDPSK